MLLAISKLFCFSCAASPNGSMTARIKVKNVFFIFFIVSNWSGNRVVTATTPGVAGEDALEGEPAALEKAVFLDGLDAVVGAGGRIAAAVADEGRQRHLINPDQENQELSGQFCDASHSS